MSDDDQVPEEQLPTDEEPVAAVEGEAGAEPTPAGPPEGGAGSPSPGPSSRGPGAYQAALPASKLSHVFFVGLVALVAGGIWFFVEQERTPALIAWIFLSAVAVLAPVAWHWIDIWNALMTRRGAAFGFVLTTVALGGAVLVAVSALNIQFRSRLPYIDTTEHGEFSLGEESTKLLAKIPGTVYLTYLIRNGDPAVRQKATQQLETFEQTCPNVRVRFLSPYRHPTVTHQKLAEWGANDPTDTSADDLIIVTHAEPGKEPAPA